MPKVYMLKLRHTGTPNIGGGEGAMWEEDVSYTLATRQDQTMFQPNTNGYIVRRLTPRECERLQGFPDDYTLIPTYRVKRVNWEYCDEHDDGAELDHYDEDTGEPVYHRKTSEYYECPDGPRYKALGNSMAVPVMRWIGERIQTVQDMLDGKEVDV